MKLYTFNYGHRDGHISEAEVCGINDMSIDAKGNIFFCDMDNSAVGAIRKITPNGIITTILNVLITPRLCAVGYCGELFISDGSIILYLGPGETVPKKLDYQAFEGSTFSILSKDITPPQFNTYPAPIYDIRGLVVAPDGNLLVYCSFVAYLITMGPNHSITRLIDGDNLQEIYIGASHNSIRKVIIDIQENMYLLISNGKLFSCKYETKPENISIKLFDIFKNITISDFTMAGTTIYLIEFGSPYIQIYSLKTGKLAPLTMNTHRDGSMMMASDRSGLYLYESRKLKKCWLHDAHWRRGIHSALPFYIREQVKTMMLILQRQAYKNQGIFRIVPRDVLFVICTFISTDNEHLSG